MKNPYSILGVNEKTSDVDIKKAYRNLARKYQTDDINPETATKKMDELNLAYDEIMSKRRSGGLNNNYSNINDSNNSESYGAGIYSSQYPDIRQKIGNGQIDDAQTLLDGIPNDMRTAEWFYLKGVVQQRKGWIEEAFKNYSIAHDMDPTNDEYKSAYNSLNNNSNQSYYGNRNYGNNRMGRSDCDACDICMGLMCFDACCDCI